jgi:peptide deformylase
MKKEDIITLPNPHLRQRSKKVGIITDAILRLVEDMKSATLDWEDSRKHEVGVALASVQVDSLLRIIVVRNDFDNKKDRTFQVFINPEVTKLEGSIVEDYEGCLSIKDVYGKVPRYEKVRVKATNLEGKTIRLTADGFLARVFQHEIDHIKDIPGAFFRLDDEGHLVELDYEKDVHNNSLLW